MTGAPRPDVCDYVAVSRPTVVILDHCAELSGGEIAMLRLLPDLRRYRPHVILAEPGPLVAELQAAGVEVEVLALDERTRSATRHDSGAGQAVTAARDVGTYVYRLSRRLRELSPVVVHSNSLKSGYYGALAAGLARRPLVWHLRDRLAEDYLPARRIALTRAVMRRGAAGVVACSAGVLDTAALPPGRKPTLVLHDGYRRRAPVADRRADVAGDLMVGMVGRLASWKGQDVFLRAFARLLADRPGFRARIIGTAMFDDAPFEKSLRELASELGVAEDVDFMGFRRDVEAELDQLDILVHASTVPEPFGQVVVEGLAAGVPVVAAAAGGPTEIIEQGVTGLLYPPGDDAALARALLQLADDNALRAAVGRAGRKSADRFEPARVAATLEDFWARVASR